MRIIMVLFLALFTLSCGQKKSGSPSENAPNQWLFNVVERVGVGVRFPIKVSDDTIEIASDMKGVLMSDSSKSKDQELLDYCGFSIKGGSYKIVSDSAGIKFVPSSTANDSLNLLSNLEIRSGQTHSQQKWVGTGDNELLFAMILVFQVSDENNVWRNAVSNTKISLTNKDKAIAIYQDCSRQRRI